MKVDKCKLLSQIVDIPMLMSEKKEFNLRNIDRDKKGIILCNDKRIKPSGTCNNYNYRGT